METETSKQAHRQMVLLAAVERFERGGGGRLHLREARSFKRDGVSKGRIGGPSSLAQLRKLFLMKTSKSNGNTVGRRRWSDLIEWLVCFLLARWIVASFRIEERGLAAWSTLHCNAKVGLTLEEACLLDGAQARLFVIIDGFAAEAHAHVTARRKFRHRCVVDVAQQGASIAFVPPEAERIVDPHAQLPMGRDARPSA
eukprot:scaffold219352_cov35-Tisochrysis_lutea.AAC.1